MDSIRFRAWNKFTKTMWKVSSIHIEDEYVDLFKTTIYGETSWAKIRDIELMQYKNLNDRNGTEIYDSDVLADENGHHYFVDDENDWEEIKSKVARKELEVIGNIYENPSLLEEST